MAEIITMPEVLAGASEAILATWLVAEGDTVEAGGTLAEAETEKAVVELPLEHSGVVGKLLAAEGDSVAVGAPIAVILASSSDSFDYGALNGSGVAAEPEPAVDVAPVAGPVPPTTPTDPAAAQAHTPGQRLFATPLVRRLARDNGVDLTQLTGTGPHGRIVRRDLEVHLREREQAVGAPTTAPTPPPGAGQTTRPEAAVGATVVPHTPMRRAIARRLTESKSTVPHFYLRARCRMDDLLALRRQVNEAQSTKVSVNDLVVRAVAVAHRAVPEANATWTDEGTTVFTNVDIAVAVSTENGLMTPVVRDVGGRSITGLAAEIGDLAERAREGRLRQHELEGGSFTVSNLGMYGVEEFAAIINPPHAGILAVGGARPEPIVEDGEVVVRTLMAATLSADHRVIDGAVAAQWLRAFVTAVENPLSLLV